MTFAESWIADYYAKYPWCTRPPWRDKTLSPETREAWAIAYGWAEAVWTLANDPPRGMYLTSTTDPPSPTG